ncbi:uncharacterized protein LY79DRAFT_229421 [Colletotrichum navitas]|uniref:Uncharacterized protein n=1 Tax=Colletotrichum navitas TaxID=681940 RepID=A0AAD8PYW4_9PEZI|nr:uncharacterized protein LY79DRAFT_229421 [Colletotrichum navitas]KAK1590094.1 hypothetical protein LY79DRAFT_229421 [Colletotrichum navitas]
MLSICELPRRIICVPFCPPVARCGEGTGADLSVKNLNRNKLSQLRGYDSVWTFPPPRNSLPACIRQRTRTARSEAGITYLLRSTEDPGIDHPEANATSLASSTRSKRGSRNAGPSLSDERDCWEKRLKLPTYLISRNKKRHCTTRRLPYWTALPCDRLRPSVPGLGQLCIVCPFLRSFAGSKQGLGAHLSHSRAQVSRTGEVLAAAPQRINLDFYVSDTNSTLAYITFCRAPSAAALFQYVTFDADSQSRP